MIGGVHDPAERAADQLADRVMRMPASAGPMVQRKCAACEGEEKEVQRAPVESGKEEVVRKEPVSRSAPVAPGAGAATASPGAANAIRSLGPGKPLARSERVFFEPRMGVDLSSVRVHDTPASDRANRAINARAFTLGNDVAFAKGEYQPESDQGRHLMAHELAHVQQQGAADYRVRRVASDFEISGKFQGSNGFPQRIYFDRKSAVVDGEEKKKIPGISAKVAPDAVIKGYRGRDEPGAVAGKRARAVEKLIKAHDKSIRVKVKPEASSLLNNANYRALRVAMPLKNSPQNAKSFCPKGAEKIKKKCPDTDVDVPRLFAEARLDLVIARKVIEHHHKDPTKFKNAKGKLEKFFRPGFDISRVIGDLGKIQAHLEHVAKKDVGRTKARPGYRCGTKCEASCQGASAVSNDVGANNLITLCPVVWENPKNLESISTLIHEASHGTSGIGKGGGGTDDVVYKGEKVFKFLSNAEALNSADVFSEFVNELIRGSSANPSKAPRDDVSSLKAGDRPLIEESLARLAKWLQATGSTMDSLHANAIKASRTGWGGKWGKPYMAELHKHFGLRAPSKKPRAKDIQSIAAIGDRIKLLSTLTNKHKIKAIDSPLPTTWSMKGSPAPSLMPGVEVELNPAAFKLLGLSAGIRDLLEALLTASPTVSSGLVHKYLAYIDWVRKKGNIGP